MSRSKQPRAAPWLVFIRIEWSTEDKRKTGHLKRARGATGTYYPLSSSVFAQIDRVPAFQAQGTERVLCCAEIKIVRIIKRTVTYSLSRHRNPRQPFRLGIRERFQ